MNREYADKLISLYPEMFMGVVDGKKLNYFHKLYNRVLFELQLNFPYFNKFEYKNVKNPFKFGFSCGDGWVGIISELILKIREINLKTGETTYAFQVKEKFGGLRFYPTNAESTKIWDIISEYEKKSFEVCEFTGSITNVGLWRYGWYQTMSEEYALKHYEIKKDTGRIPNGVKFEDCWIPNKK